MRLVLRSWGGFTGKRGMEVHDVDLDRLAPADAAGLERLVRDADFFSLPEAVEKARPQPWDFQHELTVREGDREHVVRFHVDAAPPCLRELVERLAELSDASDPSS